MATQSEKQPLAEATLDVVLAGFLDLETATTSDDLSLRCQYASELLHRSPAELSSAGVKIQQLADAVRAFVEGPARLATDPSDTVDLAVTLAGFSFVQGDLQAAKHALAVAESLAVRIGVPAKQGTAGRLLDHCVRGVPLTRTLDAAAERPLGLSLQLALREMLGEAKLVEGRLGQVDATDGAWLQALARAFVNGDAAELVELTRRTGPNAAPRERLEAYLVAGALNDEASLKRLQTPENTRKTLIDRRTASPEILRLAPLAQAIEGVAEPGGQTLAGATLWQTLADIDRLTRPLHGALCLAALGAALQRSGEAANARLVHERLGELVAKHGAPAAHLEILARTPRPGKAPKAFPWARTTAEVLARMAGFKMRSLLASEAEKARLGREVGGEIATLLFDRMHESQGFVKKLSQLGLGIEGLLPSVVRERLAAVTLGVSTASDVSVRATLAAMRDERGNAVFQDIDESPLACGTVGQVHKARLAASGEAVAVKLRYPGVEKAIAEELKGGEAIAAALSVAVPGLPVAEILKHWRRVFKQECDYRLEAENQEKARAMLSDLAGVTVPKAYPNLGSERCLVQELVQGKNFYRFVEDSTAAERDQAGERIMRAVLRLSLRGLYNHDIHPGNFLFAPTGVVMIDWGATQPVERERRRYDFAEFIHSLRSGDEDDFTQRMILAGYFDETDLDPGSERRRHGIKMHRELYLKPFMGDGPFRFTPEFAAAVVRSQLKDELPGGKVRAPNVDYVLGMRIYWSLYSLLSRLGAEARFGQLLDEEIALHQAGGRPNELVRAS